MDNRIFCVHQGALRVDQNLVSCIIKHRVDNVANPSLDVVCGHGYPREKETKYEKP